MSPSISSPQLPFLDQRFPVVLFSLLPLLVRRLEGGRIPRRLHFLPILPLGFSERPILLFSQMTSFF